MDDFVIFWPFLYLRDFGIFFGQFLAKFLQNIPYVMKLKNLFNILANFLWKFCLFHTGIGLFETSYGQLWPFNFSGPGNPETFPLNCVCVRGDTKEWEFHKISTRYLKKCSGFPNDMQQYATHHDKVYGSKPTICDITCRVEYSKYVIYNVSHIRFNATCCVFSHRIDRVTGLYYYWGLKVLI